MWSREEGLQKPRLSVEFFVHTLALFMTLSLFGGLSYIDRTFQVPFDSLLSSPVTLFPFPPNSANYDPSHFPFFSSPVSSVNSPSTPSINSTLHYLHQQHQSQSHQQQQHNQQQTHPFQQHLQQQHQQQQQERSVASQFFQQVAQQQPHHSYLNSRNFHFTSAHPSMSNMPQPNFTGFASFGGQNQKSTKKGGRRPKEEQMQLAPEEEEKRKQRRMRNKEAAARCRKRRLDHMTELSDVSTNFSLLWEGSKIWGLGGF